MNTMQCTPVKRTRRPAYPTRLQVLDDPELLQKHLPHGWGQATSFATTISLFLALNGCMRSNEITPPKDIKIAKVAPIFKYGTGRGTIGCDAVTPPVFLSEEEALVVIQEELTKVGITLSEKPSTLTNVKVPIYNGFEEVEGTYRKKQVGLKSLDADGLDLNKSIAIEFLSQRDHDDLKTEMEFSSVEEFNFQQAADTLIQYVRDSKEEVTFGTFYDPFSNIDFSSTGPQVQWETLRANAKQESLELLRAQVQNFIEWLEGQGII